MELIMKEETFCITEYGVRAGIYWRKYYGHFAQWFFYDADNLISEEFFPEGEVDRLEVIYKRNLKIRIA